MRKLYVLLAIAILAAACSAGSGAPGGANNNGGGGGKATIDLKTSGAMQGSTTQLNSYECLGAQFGAFSDTFKPVINGKEYDLGLLLNHVITTPVSFDLSSPDSKVLLQLNDLKTGTGGWRNNSESTGTVRIDAGGDSGTVDAHNLDNGLPGTFKTKLDLMFTFTCPAKK